MSRVQTEEITTIVASVCLLSKTFEATNTANKSAERTHPPNGCSHKSR